MSLSRIYQWGDYASFAALTAATSGAVDGDVGQVLMGSGSYERYTSWKYDGQLAVWRINDVFITTSSVVLANTPLAGIQGGDQVVCSDNGQFAVWNANNSTYSTLT